MHNLKIIFGLETTDLQQFHLPTCYDGEDPILVSGIHFLILSSFAPFQEAVLFVQDLHHTSDQPFLCNVKHKGSQPKNILSLKIISLEKLDKKKKNIKE